MKKESEKAENLDNEHGTSEGTERNQDKKHENKQMKHDEDEKEDPSKQETLLQIKRERRKLLKDKNRKKRARIVIRNLSFQVR